MISSQSYFSQRRTMQYSCCNLQKILLQMQLSILIISCALTCCHAFQTLTYTTEAGRLYADRVLTSSIPLSTDHQHYSSSIIPTTRRRSQLGMVIRHTSTSTNYRIQSSTTIINLSSKNKLFPQRTTQSTRQSYNTIRSMSNNKVSADNSNEETNNCPVTKLWTSFRKLLARFWVSFYSHDIL